IRPVRAGAGEAAWDRARPAVRRDRRPASGASGSLAGTGAAEAAGAPLARGELLDDVEADLEHGYDHQLGDPLERLDGERRVAAVPYRHHELALVVGIDQADEIAEDHAVPVPEAGAREHHGGEARVADVDRDAGRHEGARAGRERQRFVEAGAEIEPGAAGTAVGGQPLPHPGIEDLEFDFHESVWRVVRPGRWPALRPIARPATRRTRPGTRGIASGARRPRPSSSAPLPTSARDNAWRNPGA